MKLISLAHIIKGVYTLQQLALSHMYKPQNICIFSSHQFYCWLNLSLGIFVLVDLKKPIIIMLCVINDEQLQDSLVACIIDISFLQK